MRVAVIGAAASGLTAIKACLDENIEVTAFEGENQIGGLWQFTEHEGHSSIMRSTVINTSKQMMSYTDFPIPDDFPMFMHNTKVMEYFHLYAEHFKLYDHIKFNTIVHNVYRAKNFEETGRWNIEWAPKGKEDIGKVTETFDAVMVCTGHHWKQNWPTFSGMDIFEGKQIHSKSYKDSKGYEDKVVVVVGMGNSSGDIISEISKCTKQTYLSTQRGAWITSRHHFFGQPFDHLLSRFLFNVPDVIRNKLAEFIAMLRFDHEAWGLKPDHSYLSQHPMVNDDLPLRIANGFVVVKPNIEKLTKTGVVFTDGTVVEHVDVIIYATGYQVSFPVLENNQLINTTNNQLNLYKFLLDPELTKQTLAIIGVFQPRGALMPFADLQCRLATRVFLGKAKLPNKNEMYEDINKRMKIMKDGYYKSNRHTIQVDVTEFGDELSELIGCQPNILRMCFTDPILAFKCLFEPLYPQQYRLQGPGKWDGARGFIVNASKNVFNPMNRANRKKHVSKGMSSYVFLFLIILLAAVVLKMFYFL